MRYRIVYTVAVQKVAEKFTKKELVEAPVFFCPDDPSHSTFSLKLKFGKSSSDFLSVRIYPHSPDIKFLTLKFSLHDDRGLLREDEAQLSEERQKSGLFGFNHFYKPRDPLKATNWRVTCRFCYEHTRQFQQAQQDSSCADLSSSVSISSIPIQSDFLALLDDPTNADVTFVVQGERILAHKAVLSARSEYFKAMFRCAVKETVSNEVDVPDVDPKVFKGMLQILYSGLPPKDFKDLVWGLMVVADKYCLGEMEEMCADFVCDQVNADNVVEALLLADQIGNEKLMGRAKAVFRDNRHFFNPPDDKLKKLESSPKLLVELMMYFCRQDYTAGVGVCAL